MPLNYSQICHNLLKDLPQRQRDVILRRFGLATGQRETLEAIGKSYGICRERVRQIEEDGFSKIKPKLKNYQKTFQYFRDFLKKSGGLRREELLIPGLGGEKFKPQVFFLLTRGDGFERFPETENIFTLWTINPDSLISAKKTIDYFYNELQKINRPVNLEEIKMPFKKEKRWLPYYLEISKKIQKNSDGLFGLRNWPEINPRGVKDKAFLVFKKENKPLHFTKVASLIGETTLPQTVHNELIKDSRFVLVGRGIYALKEWGYAPGVVRDVIFAVLKEAKKPLSKEEVLEQVLKQRLVKENTILLNLSNKKYFLRNPQGKYLPIIEA